MTKRQRDEYDDRKVLQQAGTLNEVFGQ